MKPGMVIMKSNESSDATTKSTKERRSTVQTKVIMRRLPPSWTKDDFLEQLSPLPENDYFMFVKADFSLGHCAFSRAYMNFVNPDDIYDFRMKFDEYVFIDAKGGEYPAMVEFAPFQKIPKRKTKKIDAKKDTINEDADYLKFVEQIENPVVEEAPTMEATIEELESRGKKKNGISHTKTPLIEYLQRKREERRNNMQRIREERHRRDTERSKTKDDKRRKEDTRYQGTKSEKDKTGDKEREKEADRHKTSDRLRFSKENRDRSHKEKETKERSSSAREHRRDKNFESDRNRSDDRPSSFKRRPDTKADSKTDTKRNLRGDRKADSRADTHSGSHRDNKDGDREKRRDEKNIVSRDTKDRREPPHKPTKKCDSRDKPHPKSAEVTRPWQCSVEEMGDGLREKLRDKTTTDTVLVENSSQESASSQVKDTDKKERPEKALYVPRRAREAATKPSTEPSTQQPTEPSTQQPTEPSTQQPTEPSTQQPTEPSTQQPTEPLDVHTDPPTDLS